MLLAGALATTGALPAGAGPATASDAATSARGRAPPVPPSRTPGGCVPIRPEIGFYAAGRVGSDQLTTPTSRCTTISVSNVRDPANRADRCQTFRLGFWPPDDGSLTYTEPVTACGRHRTVLARNVPNDARYLVIYDVDYIDPVIQTVKFRVWH